MVGHSDAYSILKGRLENLPGNVVVIGSHTHMDNRKEKVSRAFSCPPISLRICLANFMKLIYICLASFNFFSLPNCIFFSPILVVFYLPSLEATRQRCLILLSLYVISSSSLFLCGIWFDNLLSFFSFIFIYFQFKYWNSSVSITFLYSG